MSAIALTAYNGAILGPIAKLLGWIMNLVYVAVYKVTGVESVVLSIVLITIIIYMCMLPLTIKQQKFSKLQQAMQPELNKVTEKYKGRTDEASKQLMAQEQQLVYQKYGVSPMGSCAQMLIQMPILFALYRVFYNVPGYITSVKDCFSGLADGVLATNGYQDILSGLMTNYRVMTGSGLNANNVAEKLAGAEGDALKNFVVDILYKLPSNAWANLTESFPNLGDQISSTLGHLNKFNYFLGMNISDTPMAIIKENFTSEPKHLGFVILALMIPVLSWLTQVLSMKLMPTAKSDDPNADKMSQQMKTMNTMMPLMSLVICFSVPVGLGIYWIMSAVVRVVQMYFINKKIANLDLDAVIAKNAEKAKKAREKAGIAENQIREAAAIKTKKIENKAKVNVSSDNESALSAANEKKASAKAGSMAAKANMVRDFNERSSRK